MKKTLKTVISGSYRKYLPKIGIALEKFKKSNINVLSPLTEKVVMKSEGFVFLSTDNPEKTADEIEKDFMINIKKSDFMYLANINGYVGESAATEIGVAIINGTPIIACEKINNISKKIPLEIQKILERGMFKILPINKINTKNINNLNFKEFSKVKLATREKLLFLSLIEKLLKGLKPTKR